MNLKNLPQLYSRRFLTLHSSKGFTNIAFLIALSLLLLPAAKLALNSPSKPTLNSLFSRTAALDEPEQCKKHTDCGTNQFCVGTNGVSSCVAISNAEPGDSCEDYFSKGNRIDQICSTQYCNPTTLKCEIKPNATTATPRPTAKPGSTAPSATETPGPTATPTPAPPSTPGFCAGPNQANANPVWYIKGGTPTCNFGSTINPSLNTYCGHTFGGSQNYFYACPGTAGGTTPGAGGDAGIIICAGKGGVDGNKYPNGYVAPICSNVDPAPDTWSKFIFDAAKAQKQEYKGNKNYDVFLCTNGSYDFAPKPPKGNTDLCNAYPWTQDAKGSTPTPKPGSPTHAPCKAPIPYWDGQKCTVRPDACLSATNDCLAASACPSVPQGETEPNVACHLQFGDSNLVCCPKAGSPTTAPPAAATVTPVPPSGGCTVDGAACGNNSNNACHSGWNTSALSCCPFSQRYCSTLNRCTISTDCPSTPPPTPTPTQTPGGGNPPNSCGRTGANNIQDEHCYGGDNDCACGYTCIGSGGSAHCRATPFGSAGNACADAGGIGCAIATGSNSPGSYCVATFGAGSTAISGQATGDACRSNGANYCCTAPTGGGAQPGAATATPRPAAPTATRTPVSAPTNCNDLSSGLASCGDSNSADNTNICGGNYHYLAPDLGCGTERYCYVCDSGTASVGQSVSVCKSNVQCVSGKLGNACVFYGKSSIGVCKTVQ